MLAVRSNISRGNRTLRQKAQGNHNLEQQAQALYKSWFVDFEPFKGGKFVDSELGLIPEGWLLDVALRNTDISILDRMSLLMTCCKDCIGAVSVIPMEEKEGNHV